MDFGRLKFFISLFGKVNFEFSKKLIEKEDPAYLEWISSRSMLPVDILPPDMYKWWGVFFNMYDLLRLPLQRDSRKNMAMMKRFKVFWNIGILSNFTLQVCVNTKHREIMRTIALFISKVQSFLIFFLHLYDHSSQLFRFSTLFFSFFLLLLLTAESACPESSLLLLLAMMMSRDMMGEKMIEIDLDHPRLDIPLLCLELDSTLCADSTRLDSTRLLLCEASR